MNTTTALGRFRLIALLEGISYLVLMAIGMPFKYIAQIMWPIKVLGYAHGFLFIAFVAALLQVWVLNKWSFMDVVKAFIASLVPFGTLIMDKHWKKLA